MRQHGDHGNRFGVLLNGVPITDLTYVCGIGSQEFANMGTRPETISKFAGLFGRRELPAASSLEGLFRALGIEYVSIDVTPEATVFLDLNFDRVPRRLRGKFDLIVNGGTTKHVFNQLNAFKAIHDLAREGAVMYHAVPICGFTNHGLLNYNMWAFFALCKANDYAPLNCHIDYDPAHTRIHEDVLDFVTRYVPPHWSETLRRKLVTMDATLRISLQKTSSDPFNPPLDLPPAIDGHWRPTKAGKIKPIRSPLARVLRLR